MVDLSGFLGKGQSVKKWDLLKIFQEFGLDSVEVWKSVGRVS